jgi:hypothetical protein
MKTITLTIGDRINLLNKLPESGSFTEMITIRSIMQAVEIAQSEKEEINLNQQEGLIRWDNYKAKDKEIDFSDEQVLLIKKIVKDIDEAKGIDISMLPLCEKIYLL